jgi:hypothetical protein
VTGVFGVSPAKVGYLAFDALTTGVANLAGEVASRGGRERSCCLPRFANSAKEVSVAFFDTTSLYFEGAGAGKPLGTRGVPKTIAASQANHPGNGA